MFQASSFAEPKLSELVPTLTGESNFAPWSTALKCLGKGNTPTKPKHFCTFYQRKAAHTSEECFKNPANAKNNANTAKSVNAINAPALTSNNDNPVVRYNNLFNN
ncbi:hypothetical protein N7527_003054 [Penicillium freii]|nr:hypothetical protein N7527_003054 [Penicillium freii]